MTQRLFSKAGLLMLALCALLLVIAVNQMFKGSRIDLTEGRLYTLSEGTHNLLGNLGNDALIEFFYSDSQTGDVPFLRNYARRVTELLEEYVMASHGKLTLRVVDPEPFSEDEDKASEYGLQAIPLGAGGKEAYFGLVITSREDGNRREAIPFIHPEKERFLEYEISKLIFSVTEKEKPKIGLISQLDVEGGYDMATRQPSGPWVSTSQLKQLYDVKSLDSQVTSIPDDLKQLVVIYPKELSEQTRYAIDQFVLKGGHALVFVDPNAETDNSGMGGMNGMMMAMGGGKSATLEPLFKAWGVEVDTDKVLADGQHALSVGTQGGRSIRHLGILGFGADSFNTNDVVTTALKSINMATVGAIQKIEGATTNIEVLLNSSNKAMLMDAQKFAFLMDPSSLYKDFKPTGEQYVVAARITGKVKSAYPQGRPEEKAEGENIDEAAETEGHEKTDKPVEKTKAAKREEKKQEAKAEDDEEYLAESAKDINVIVVADTDVLSDRLWVQKTSFFGQQITQPFANNGDFLINMVDNLTGNADLISIRSRGQFSRPFDTVNELERAAESSFYQKEEELKQQLSETESKLRQLQTKKEGAETLVLSDEQQTELENFMQEKLRIRKELRNVQHQLGKDIEQLGTHLKLINILAVPLLLTLLALGFRVFRRRRS